LITIDYVLLAVLVLSSIVGLFRGIIKEGLSLVSWVAAIWCGWRFGAAAGAALPHIVDSQVIQMWFGRIVVLVTILIVGGLLGWLLSYLTDKSGLSGTDRLIGMVFGLGRGIVLAGLVVIVLQMAGFDRDSWWKESRLIPYAAPVAALLRQKAQGEIKRLQEHAVGTQT